MIKFIKRNLKLITIINVMIIISSLIICKYFLLQKEEKNDEVKPFLKEQVEKITLEEIDVIKKVLKEKLQYLEYMK